MFIIHLATANYLITMMNCGSKYKLQHSSLIYSVQIELWASNKSAQSVIYRFVPTVHKHLACSAVMQHLRSFIMTSVQSLFLWIPLNSPSTHASASVHFTVCTGRVMVKMAVLFTAALKVEDCSLFNKRMLRSNQLHLWECLFVYFGGVCVEKQLPILDASPQYCHSCRCCHDDWGGRPVSLPQFFSRVSDDYL